MVQPVTENYSSRAGALVFDLGGVLVGIGWDRAFEYWSGESGVQQAQLRERFRFDDAYAAHERNELSRTAYFAHLRTTLGLALTDEQIRSGWNAMLLEPLH